MVVNKLKLVYKYQKFMDSYFQFIKYTSKSVTLRKRSENVYVNKL